MYVSVTPRQAMAALAVGVIIGISLSMIACGSPPPCDHDAAPIPVDSMSDSMPDASVVDWSQPWELHTITRTGIRGADGVGIGDVNGDGIADVVSGFEEGGGVTLSLGVPDPLVASEWPTVRLSASTTGYEDAKIGHFGTRAVVVGGADANNRLTVWLAPTDQAQLLTASAWTTVQLAPLVGGSHHFMQIALADIDGDGTDDVVFGTRVEPSIIGWFHTPADPSFAANWSAPTIISAAGWVMSLEPRDLNGDGRIDLFVTDRSSHGSPAQWDLFGARWLENTPTGFLNHPIAGTNHDGSPKFSALCALDGPGNPLAVVEVRGDEASQPPRFPNSLYIRRNTSMTWNGAWSTMFLPLSDAYDLGTLQGAACGDVDGDGVLDVVLSASYGHDASRVSYRDATASNLAWVSGADWAMHPIAGIAGVKFDNTVVLDVDGDGALDVVQSEQGDASIPTPDAEQLLVHWWRNPR